MLILQTTLWLSLNPTFHPYLPSPSFLLLALHRGWRRRRRTMLRLSPAGHCSWPTRPPSAPMATSLAEAGEGARREGRLRERGGARQDREARQYTRYVGSTHGNRLKCKCTALLSRRYLLVGGFDFWLTIDEGILCSHFLCIFFRAATGRPNPNLWMWMWTEVWTQPGSALLPRAMGQQVWGKVWKGWCGSAHLLLPLRAPGGGVTDGRKREGQEEG